VRKAGARRSPTSLDSPLTVSLLLVGFAEGIAVWQDLTGSKPLLQEALDRGSACPARRRCRASTPGRHTVVRRGRPGRGTRALRLPGRKAIILIADSVAKAVESAQQADAVMYGIHFGDDERGPSHRDGLAP
jgi:hypothetical protein